MVSFGPLPGLQAGRHPLAASPTVIPANLDDPAGMTGFGAGASTRPLWVPEPAPRRLSSGVSEEVFRVLPDSLSP
ncbi:hypothetical protein DAMNIGENAA_20430 [Desulforhabdus amnigena]|uniref:Uncharacterized protein n=1 Tax=Desulforhabdus amnigena TaxID=40218 RepID=A0A9W6FTR6_9BACT|nr:hypothetical protein DAMNIGENAA_20430 [Desulforhabdus amnigena]